MSIGVARARGGLLGRLVGAWRCPLLSAEERVSLSLSGRGRKGIALGERQRDRETERRWRCNSQCRRSAIMPVAAGLSVRC